MAATRNDANSAYQLFVDTYSAKYPRAVERLIKDREEPSPSTTSRPSTGATCGPPPIESTFARVRLRTRRTKGSGSGTA